MIPLGTVGAAFGEGLLLIASPCILPVLPLVLSSGVEGGKARPFGITLGFVVAFSAFVLLSRQIVGALHIEPDTIRYVSLAVLFLLGLVMLSETLSQKFSSWTQGLANIGAKAGGNNEGGFGSGIAIGALIGLVWTPCAGPILATVLVQVIQQKTDLEGALVTLAFAVGASLPMLAITLAGKEILKKFSFVTKHTELVRKIFAVLILLSVAFLALGSTATNLFASGGAAYVNSAPSEQKTSIGLQSGLQTSYRAPDFVGISAWLNSDPLTMEQLKGKVVLVDFWTYSCINCVRTLPYITAWDQKYRDQGLVIVGVHSPEFEFEKKTDNIQTAMEKYGIHYPVAVDNDLATWQNFKNRYWPAHYLIDRNGKVVYTHSGEGHYDITENNIRYLLGLKGPADTNAIMPPTLHDETPETYLGYKRADRFIATSDAQQDVVASYKPVNFVPLHHWTLDGIWIIAGDKITSSEAGSSLRLNFRAKKVFLVMGTKDGQPQTVSLKLNGSALAPAAFGKDVYHSGVTISGHALYDLVNQPTPENSMLEITANAPGIEMYAFTFGE